MLKLFALAACLLCTAAAPAFAQDTFAKDTPDDVQVNVSYADLNLSAPAGISALDHRIALAAKQICGDADMRNIIEWKAAARCRTQTELKARPARDAALASAKPTKDVQTVLVAAK